MRPRRTERLERLARVHDAEIAPVWTDRFAALLLGQLRLGPADMVLDAGTGTGGVAVAIARTLEGAGRVVAIDGSPAMLDVARARAGALDGRRVFFRGEPAGSLPLPDGSFDAVVANLSLEERGGGRVQALGELTRVCRAGGSVCATLPLAGSWTEVLDLLREVLVRLDRAEAIERLEAWREGLPDDARLAAEATLAGLEEVRVASERFTLLFRSSREFFCAPVVEFGPLLEWRAIAGGGADATEVLLGVRDAIDAYFGAAPFAVAVHAGCVVGRAPSEAAREARAALAALSIEEHAPEPLSIEEVLDEAAEAVALAADLDRIAAPRARPR